MKTFKRGLALALCLLTALSLCMPAMAAAYSHKGMTVGSAPIYQNVSTTSKVLATVQPGQYLAIDGQYGDFYRVVLNPSAAVASYGWVQKAAVTNVTTVSGAPVKSPGTSSSSNNNKNNNSTGNSIIDNIPDANEPQQPQASGTPGYITNCNSYVNFRASASTSGKKLGTLDKNTALTILGTESSFYKVVANGQTGYVSKQYVAQGTLSSGTTTPSAGSQQQNNAASGDVAVQAGSGKGAYASYMAQKMAAAKAINSDVKGYIYIPGTNIDFPILANAKDMYYYSDRNINKQKDSKGSIYSFYSVLTRNNVVTGHNMRTSGTMFHELHHIQEKTLGYSTCQVAKSSDCKRCNRSIPSSTPSLTVAANRIWNVSLHGYTQWQVWAMYEVKADEPKSTISYNCQHMSSASKAQINAWIQHQLSRSQVNFGTKVSADDVFLTIDTCGTNYDSSTAQSRLYYFLKAVG